MLLDFVFRSLTSQGENPFMGISEIDLSQIEFGSEFDTHYGLVAPSQTVLVRAYSDDTDEQMLSELTSFEEPARAAPNWS